MQALLALGLALLAVLSELTPLTWFSGRPRSGIGFYEGQAVLGRFSDSSGDAPEGVWYTQKPSTAGFLDGLPDPDPLPPWLTTEDLDYYEEQYKMSGFRGPINWYRNIDRNIEITPQLAEAKIEQPSFFIAGKKDLVLSFAGGEMLDLMSNFVSDMRGKVLIDGAGHWVQMEKPAEVNEALLGFLKQFA